MLGASAFTDGLAPTDSPLYFATAQFIAREAASSWPETPPRLRSPAREAGRAAPARLCTPAREQQGRPPPLHAGRGPVSLPHPHPVRGPFCHKSHSWWPPFYRTFSNPFF